MNVSTEKSWVRFVACYWLLMAAVFFLDFRYMESDWAGLPGFILTLPLSALVVVIGLSTAIAAHYGYGHDIDMTGNQFEYGFIVCAVLNAFILYPAYLLWRRWRAPKVFDSPPPPNK